MSYIIAIPSYKRSNIINFKTLMTLKNHNIKRSKIYIFVANDVEYSDYIKNVDKSLYNKIIIGEKGLKNQRNFIVDYFKEGINLVQMDDDIDDIVELIPNDNRRMNKLISIKDLNRFFVDAFRMIKKKNIFIWGIYPVSNPYFMTDTITNDLRFIVGPMWGIVNRHNNELKLTIDEKENVERNVMDGQKLN